MNNIQKIKSLYCFLEKQDLYVFLARTINLLNPVKEEIQRITIDHSYEKEDNFDGDYNDDESEPVYFHDYSTTNIFDKKGKNSDLTNSLQSFIGDLYDKSYDMLNASEINLTKNKNESGSEFLKRYINGCIIHEEIKSVFFNAIDNNLPIKITKPESIKKFDFNSIISQYSDNIEKELNLNLFIIFINFTSKAYELIQKDNNLLSLSYNGNMNWKFELLDEKPFTYCNELYLLKQYGVKNNETLKELLNIFDEHYSVLKETANKLNRLDKTFTIEKGQSLSTFRNNVIKATEHYGKDTANKIFIETENKELNKIMKQHSLKNTITKKRI